MNGMKTFRSFIISFSAAGLIVALIVNLLWSSFGDHIPRSLDTILLKTTLMFFPAYIGAMSLGKSNYWSLVVFGFMFYNIVLYAIFGCLTWLGIVKHKVYFLIEAVIVTALWFGIWVLM